MGMCDLDEQRLERIAGQYAVTVAETDLTATLRSAEPDVVVIATEESSHAAEVLQALDAGLDVFVEKPLAMSSGDAGAILQLARAAKREVIVGHIARFSMAAIRLHSAATMQRIGPLHAMRFRRDFPRAWFGSFGARVHPVWESCIHDIDLAISFVHVPMAQVVALQSMSPPEVPPRVVTAVLLLENGVMATIESAWVLPESAPQTMGGATELSGTIAAEVELLGGHGVAHHRSVGDGLVEWGADTVHVPDLDLWPEVGGVIGGALRREVEYAIRVFRREVPADMMPLEEACWGVEAAEAIERAIIASPAKDLRFGRGSGVNRYHGGR